MLPHGASRKQIARTLNAAYADGLISDDTFTHRVDQLIGPHLIEPFGLVGDLNLRARPMRRWRRLRELLSDATHRRADPRDTPARLLGLDWTGAQPDLLVGRHHSCDVVLGSSTVSRRHAQLRFRDGNWVLQDLDSTNGTVVNGVRVGRCSLRPGDRILLGNERLQVD